MNRRTAGAGGIIAGGAVLLLAAALLAGCGRTGWTGTKKVIVLGFDGMDPRIVREMFARGELPHLKALAETGGFRDMWSSVPPQSPVAWSNFITGKNPGGHAIFDFVHRDPATYLPYLSTSETIPPARTLAVGDYVLPLSGGSVVLKREGRAFWEYLAERGIPSTVFRIPSNYPPVECGAKSLSGMGTPDLLGSYGIYQFFTSDPSDIPADPSGAEFTLVAPAEGMVRTSIMGPANGLKKGSPRIPVPFTARIDEANRVARLELPGRVVVLAEGEWSDWIELSFPRAPLLPPVHGICRLYLKAAAPHFKLYVSPLNVDPLKPALPIDSPPGFARELAERAGLFYTQGMPENTKTLTNKTFTTDEFYSQCMMVLDEANRLFDDQFSRFRAGFFFYYYSTTDLGSHIFWHLRDKNHPVYDAAARKRLGDVIEEIYRRMDEVVGKVEASLDADTTLIIMSDHGFSPYYRAFNLNRWLVDNGYLVLRGGAKTGSLYKNIDWSRTRVYALGLNSLYINLAGREKSGIVPPGAEKDSLAREIAGRLEAVTDPENGKRVVKRAHLASEIYTGDFVAKAPDLIVGYDWGYRTSWESALGDIKEGLLATSREKWSGDHCGATDIVPGILFSNRKLILEEPHLYDLTPTILGEFGIPKPADMIGHNVFEAPPPPAQEAPQGKARSLGYL